MIGIYMKLYKIISQKVKIIIYSYSIPLKSVFRSIYQHGGRIWSIFLDGLHVVRVCPWIRLLTDCHNRLRDRRQDLLHRCHHGHETLSSHSVLSRRLSSSVDDGYLRWDKHTYSIRVSYNKFSRKNAPNVAFNKSSTSIFNFERAQVNKILVIFE